MAVGMAESGQEEMEEKHKALVTDMFQKITDYLNGELAGLWRTVFYQGFIPDKRASANSQILIFTKNRTPLWVLS